jgi:hypothetical protein
MSRDLAGRRKDKDRARRARRLSGAAPPQRKLRKPDTASEDWDDEPREAPDE